MELFTSKHNLAKQFAISTFLIFGIVSVCYMFNDLIGYRNVALILLAAVSILAIFLSIYPVLLAAILSALSWDFFFIPPHFTFHIDKSEDVLTLMMYFVIALINGVFTYKIRQYEIGELKKEERQNSIKLYKTLFDSISHELRTPISAIIGHSDNLVQKDKKISEEEKKSSYREISAAGYRLNYLVHNLLDMQRIESGLLKAKFDWCDINELINFPLNRLEAELSNHMVSVKIQENFPLIKLDFGLMEQAIFNILHNAGKYTPPKTHIQIEAAFTDNIASIIISNDAESFSEETMKHLFSKFYRNNKKNIEGIGLGLSITKGFIEANNGTIEADNNFPKGVKFTIKISTPVYMTNNQIR